MVDREKRGCSRRNSATRGRRPRSGARATAIAALIARGADRARRWSRAAL